MCLKVDHSDFSKTIKASLIAAVLLAIVAVPNVADGADQKTHSLLWGRDGELWWPGSRLPDFSYAGYYRGEPPLPVLNADINVRDFGIMNLRFEFPVTPYEGHFTELGYNAIAMRDVRNCWVRNVRIHNSDSGMFISGNNMTNVFYGTAIQGAKNRADRADINKALIECIKRGGFTVAFEHTRDRIAKETVELLGKAVLQLERYLLPTTIWPITMMLLASRSPRRCDPCGMPEITKSVNVNI